ncbi:protein TolQ [Umboniibacter marinipuniceus]|uniref:Tol-Pal system protein TolQ n=1 Tax=Umboniibacter marinipuniceus TaxID=569599 RepID=A0A3M0A4F2_9GAMM|nr:protein TolQ [Umboniibacter marinipuniceus]RMA79254.1 cell division and transport-associated protein TolQ [Umboniibacter marinipuniceus]
MSFLGLIGGASFLVQMVMLTLVAASVASWVLIYQRWSYFKALAESDENFEERFWSGDDLGKIYASITSDKSSVPVGMEAIFVAGFKEFARLRADATRIDDISNGVSRAMRIARNREEDRLETQLPFLASVASTSPYVGLFGTVWGIMNSFRGLSDSSQATLAAVAPGISEALIATAMGLFAAIPAVMAYNRYAAKMERHINRHDTFAEEFSSLLHRQLLASRKQAEQR